MSRLTLIVLFLTHCSMNSADIKKGEYLDRAQLTSVEDYFQKRMKNKIKKVQGANWEIFFESDEFVYFGYPLISFFREGTFVDKFFKVNRISLETIFPVYRKFDGILMNRNCKEYLINFKKTDSSKQFLFLQCTSSLKEEAIHINAIMNFKTREGENLEEKYILFIDKKNLNLKNIIKIKE